MTTPDLPDQLEHRLRRLGATDAELRRFRAEHEKMDYYHRFVANQHGQGMDDASVHALLELSRARWAEQPDEEEDQDTEPGDRDTTLGDQGTGSGWGGGKDAGPEVPPVPDGPIQSVLDYVNQGPTAAEVRSRARAALEVEQSKPANEQRQSLITRLEKHTE